MSDEAELIARYRAHATSLRTIAKDAPDAKTRLALVTIADDFDRMADSAEGPIMSPKPI
jgi:hypothetical protein